MDENKALELRRLAGQERFKSIQEPMTFINGRRYHFTDTAMEQLELTVRLPNEFLDMPPNLVKAKYPVESRPSFIKTTVDTMVNLAFSWMPQRMTQDYLIRYRNEILDTLKKLYGQFDYLDTGVEYQKEGGLGQLICWYDYISPALDMKIYNLHAYICINEKPLFVMFNCPQMGMDEWRPIAFQILRTIEKA